jgi:hypothetical protein
MCIEAKKRLAASINRSAGQHLRAMRLASTRRDLRDFGVVVIDTAKLRP